MSRSHISFFCVAVEFCAVCLQYLLTFVKNTLDRSLLYIFFCNQNIFSGCQSKKLQSEGNDLKCDDFEARTSPERHKLQ